MKLSQRMQNVVESQTIAMTKKARELKSKGHDVISLSIGEPDFDTPEVICNSANRAMGNGETHYPPVLGTIDFRTAIKNKLLKENNIEVELDEIIVSNGAKQSIFNAVMTLINPGDEVIIPAPYWVSYPSMVHYAGGKVVSIESSAENHFKISAEELESKINANTRLIIFSSPCNPSGSVMSTEEIEEWVNVLEKHPDVYVIADEIYEKILFTDKPKSLGSYPSLKGRIATVNGLSKGYAMTGWRIGYMAGPKEWIQACEKYQGMISSGANSVGQAAGAFALHNLAAQQEVENMRISFNKRRQLMSQMIADIHGMNCPEPQGAFYYFPDVSHYFGQTTADSKRIMNSDDLCMYLLETAHVATVSGSAFGTPSCIRLSYAASEEQLTEAMKRISMALTQLN